MHSPEYLRLKEFLQERMRMRHVNKPLILRTLLPEEDRATERTIHAAFLDNGG